jgi:hypothetical protein
VFALVGGEAGVGETRLAGELAAQAADAAFSYSSANARNSGGRPAPRPARGRVAHARPRHPPDALGEVLGPGWSCCEARGMIRMRAGRPSQAAELLDAAAELRAERRRQAESETASREALLARKREAARQKPTARQRDTPAMIWSRDASGQLPV